MARSYGVMIAAAALARAGAMDVKVFLLAGQSNMEGHGVAVKAAGANEGNGTLEWSVEEGGWESLPVCATMAEATDKVGCRAEGADFAGLMTSGEGGNWSVFEDTQVVFEGSTSKRGPLSIGFGFQDAWIGPEYGFGLRLGSYYAEGTKILLLKWAWGGTDLQHDWRPPSSGGTVGWCYGNMTKVVHAVLDSQLPSIFPGFDPATDAATLEGFVWHQGWNDGCGDGGTEEYETNLAHLIHDVRTEFDRPTLPVSVGLSGFGGWGQNVERRLEIMRAQYNVSTYVDNVGTVETRGFFREFTETKGAINQGYHWFGNGETYLYLGTAMGNCMRALLDGNWTQPVIDYLPPTAEVHLGACGAYEDGAPCQW